MSTRETMKRLAEQEAERTSAGAAGHKKDQLRFWEEKSAEIEQNCLKLLRAELGAATTRLELSVTDSLYALAKNLRADNLEKTAELLAELVKKIGDLITTLEAVSAKTGQKLDDLAFRGDQMQKLVHKQQEQIMLFESLVTRGNKTAERMHSAAHAGIKTMWLRRGRDVILSICLIVLATVVAGSYLHRWIYQPTWQVIEASNYWELFTYEMTGEQKAKVIEQLKVKQRRIEQEGER